MSTIAQVLAAAPSLVRLKNPGPRGTGRRTQGTEAHMSWMVNIGEAQAALTVMGGVLETFTIYNQTLQRLVPLRHPVYTNLIADQIDWEDVGWEGGGAGGTAGETLTKIHVTFRTPNFALDGNQPFVEISGTVSPRIVPAPQNAFQSGHQPYQSDGSINANGCDLNIVLHQIPVFNLGAWLQYANSVNSTTFMDCPVGSLLYLGPQWHIQQQLGGVTSYQVGIHFKATDPNRLWNYAYQPDGAWAQLKKADGSDLYPAVDFNTLFVG